MNSLIHPRVFGGCVANLFVFLCCVCLRPLTRVPIVSEFSILEYSFHFPFFYLNFRNTWLLIMPKCPNHGIKLYKFLTYRGYIPLLLYVCMSGISIFNFGHKASIVAKICRKPNATCQMTLDIWNKGQLCNCYCQRQFYNCYIFMGENNQA